jgi:type IV secretory pathway VirB10-like protein
MDEPRPTPQILMPKRGAWITRNKKLLSAVGIGGLLLLFVFGHRSTVQQQVDQQNQERNQAARKENDAAAAGRRPKTSDPREDSDQGRTIVRDGAKGASGDARNGASPEKSKIETAREDLKYKSLYTFNVSETKQAGTATKPPNEPHLEQTADKKPVIPTIDFNPNQPLYLLPEGTMVEAGLLNKLDGTMAGPVDCQVRTDVYYPRTRVLLLPQGARFLGEAQKVSAFGQERLALVFHRILVFRDDPDATYSIPLDKEPGLDQQGTPGIGGKVNNHILSSLGIAGAIGAIAGLAQLNNGYSGYGYDPGVEMRVGMTQSMSQSSMRILDRFLNRLPTIEISPGTRVNIRLNQDIRIPAVQEEKNAKTN